MARLSGVLWAAAAAVSCLLPGAAAQFPPIPLDNLTITPFPVTMSDGLVLVSTLYTLKDVDIARQRIAVQHQAFPYTAEFEKVFGYMFSLDPLLKVQHGHGLLMQEMRGTRNGTGEFNGFHGISDIRDTINWLRRQPWWNGVLFGTGYSAMGSLSYMAMLAGVRFTAQSLFIAAGDEYHFVYQNGAFKSLLVNGMLRFVGHGDYNTTYIAHEAPDDFWAVTNIDGHYGNVQWPAVHTAGWYDVFQRDNLRAFDGYRTQADPSVRDLQFLVVNPNGHCFGGGAVDWGDKTMKLLQLISYLLGDVVLGMMHDAGTPLKFAASLELLRLVAKPLPRAIWYVMGPGLPGTQGNWITMAKGLPQPQMTVFYLGPQRALSRSPAADPLVEQYVYDPSNPLRSWGGCNMGAPPNDPEPYLIPCGPWDQLPVYANRTDVLLFDSAPLPKPTAITGLVTAVLFVSTSAVDTDFTAKLVDVFPNGTRLLLLDGIQRLRWRQVKAGPRLVVPGIVYRVEVDLWSTSYIFPSGHRIGLDVSSSNFPRFDANPNTGRSLAENARGPHESVIAVNRVHIGPTFNSHVLLPLVPIEAVAPAAPKALEALLALLRHRHRAGRGAAQ